MRLVVHIVIGLVLSMQMLTMNAEADVTNINNQELAALLEKDATLIDIRTDPEWRQTGIAPWIKAGFRW